MANLMQIETAYVGYSLSKLFKIKLFVLLRFIFQFFKHPIRRWQRLSILKQVRGVSYEIDCLIIATGPSATKIDPEKIKKLQESKRLEVIVVNDFDRMFLAKSLIPNKYVLADPYYFDFFSSDSFAVERSKQIWEYISSNSVDTWISDRLTPPIPTTNFELGFFSSLGLEGYSKNISPLRPRSFMSLTAHYALAIAGHFGYRKVFIIGLDNTQFRSLRLQNGAMVLGSHHAFDETQDPPIIPDRFSDGVAGFWADTARKYADLKLFSSLPVWNLDSETLIDAFPVAGEEEMQKFMR